MIARYVSIVAALLLAVASLVSGAQDTMPAPNPNPQPGYGPYHGVAGVTCYKGQTDPHYKMVHCECSKMCPTEGTPDPPVSDKCQTRCGEKDQCKCHLDGDCDEDMPMPEPPR
jgi:hypothetical protein